MTSWQIVLRDGFLPLFSTERLAATLEALEKDDSRLTQGSTATPPPLMGVQDWPVEACCPISYFAADDPFESTVGEVEEAFAKACFDADQRLGEPAACRWLLNWIDDTDRQTMLTELAAEVRTELAKRKSLVEAAQ
jgi:hypothetical protein